MIARLADWLATRTTRERRLLQVAAGAAVLALVVATAFGVVDDLDARRARVTARERELHAVRRLAAELSDLTPRADGDGASLLTRLVTTADAVVGRTRIAAMTPIATPETDVVRSERVALRLAGASLAETVRLLHTLATAAPPLTVSRLEMRKHPDDARRFDATLEVTSLRGPTPGATAAAGAAVAP